MPTHSAITGHQGEIAWDDTKPDGTMLKRMEMTRLQAMGWSPRMPLEQGLAETYSRFLEQSQVRV